VHFVVAKIAEPYQQNGMADDQGFAHGRFRYLDAKPGSWPERRPLPFGWCALQSG
jgi:hypothetical protein